MAFKALQPIRHNGTDYAVGDDVDITGKEAAQLINDGVLEKTADTKKGGKAADEPALVGE